MYRERKYSPDSMRLRWGLDLDRVVICEGIQELKFVIFRVIEFRSRA